MLFKKIQFLGVKSSVKALQFCPIRNTGNNFRAPCSASTGQRTESSAASFTNLKPRSPSPNSGDCPFRLHSWIFVPPKNIFCYPSKLSFFFLSFPLNYVSNLVIIYSPHFLSSLTYYTTYMFKKSNPIFLYRVSQNLPQIVPLLEYRFAVY